MQKLLTTRDAEMMANLYRYLQQNGVPVTVSEQGNQLELWLTVSSYHAHAKALIQAFKDNPELAKQVVEPSADNTLDNTREALPPSLMAMMLRQVGWFTALYAAAVVLIFIGLMTPLAEPILNALLFNPNSFEDLPWTQPWRFFSPADRKSVV